MDTDDDILALIERDANEDSSDDVSDEEVVTMQPPIARKKKATVQNVLVSKPKLPTIPYSEAHHKWGHHGEDEKLRKMAKTQGLRLIGKMELCEAFGIVKVK